MFAHVNRTENISWVTSSHPVDLHLIHKKRSSLAELGPLCAFPRLQNSWQAFRRWPEVLGLQRLHNWTAHRGPFLQEPLHFFWLEDKEKFLALSCLKSPLF